MSLMKRLLDEVSTDRWKILPAYPKGYRLMENIGHDKPLWVERRESPNHRLLQFTADTFNKENYRTPSTPEDAKNRAAYGVISKWNTTLEEAKCKITKKTQQT